MVRQPIQGRYPEEESAESGHTQNNAEKLQIARSASWRTSQGQQEQAMSRLYRNIIKWQTGK